MLLVEIEDIVHRNEAWDIGLRFLRKIFPQLPVIPGSCTSYGFVQIAGSAVVSGDGQVPVLVHFVQVPEIASTGVRIADRVKEGVHIFILPQSILHPCAGHELPQSTCACPAGGPWVEGALHHGQIFEFTRNAIAVKLAFKQREIVGGQTYDFGIPSVTQKLPDIGVGDVIVVDAQCRVGVQKCEAFLECGEFQCRVEFLAAGVQIGQAVYVLRVDFNEMFLTCFFGYVLRWKLVGAKKHNEQAP